MSVEEFIGESALADYGAERADRNIFSRMGNDDSVAAGDPVFGVAAAFGNEFKAVESEDGNEFGGWDSLRHGGSTPLGDGEFSDSYVSNLWNGGRIGEVFEIEFDGLLEVGKRFRF